MMVMNPAAGPETPKREPLHNPTTIPPITPANHLGKTLRKEDRFSRFVEARPMPKKVAIPLKTQLILRENLSQRIY